MELRNVLEASTCWWPTHVRFILLSSIPVFSTSTWLIWVVYVIQYIIRSSVFLKLLYSVQVIPYMYVTTHFKVNQQTITLDKRSFLITWNWPFFFLISQMHTFFFLFAIPIFSKDKNLKSINGFCALNLPTFSPF